jgi:hypothetical protein
MSPARPDQQSDTIAAAQPPRRSTPALPTESLIVTSPSRHTKAKTSHQILRRNDEPQPGNEIENTTPTPTSPPLRKPKAVRHEPSDDDETNQKICKQRLPVRKRPTLPSRVKRQSFIGHIVIADATDSQMLTSLLRFSDSSPSQNRILKTLLDASMADEGDDFHLATALNTLHPHPNGSNSHNLQAMKLVVKGNVLYTRYTYYLASPALTENVNAKLSRLANVNLIEQEKTNLTYKVTSTEKGVAKAILGIRGLKKVLMSGTGKMEGEFASVIKATLSSPPGTDITMPAGKRVPNSTLQLFGKGVAEPAAYHAKVVHHSTTARGNFKRYPTRSTISRYDSCSLGSDDR